MIKFDKVTLEPKFIDPSMCFCGGGGGGGGGGAPQEPRGTVFGVDGVSKTGSTFDDRAIGFTDDRGGRGANYESLRDATASQTRAAIDAARAKAAAEFDAYGDLDRRAEVGQMPNLSKGFETPLGRIPTPTSAVIGAVNRFGMSRARDIRDKIDAGGVPVKDKFGRIQGVVSQGTGPVAGLLGAFGQNTNVYTGSPSFAPTTSEQLMSYQPLSQGLGSFDPATMPPSDMRRAAQPLSQPVTTRDTLSGAQTLPMDLSRNQMNSAQFPKSLSPDVTSVTAFSPTGAPFSVPINMTPINQDSLTPAQSLANEQAVFGVSTPLSAEPLDRDLMMDALMRGVNNPQSNPQLGTISDPTVTAFNIGSGLTEDPRAIAEREQILDRVRAAASGEPFPEDRNMYGLGAPDLGTTLTPAQLETYQDSSLSPQYGTVNDPTAQAGMLEGIGNFFGYTSPAKSAPLSGYFKGGKGARTYYQGPGQTKRVFENPATSVGEAIKRGAEFFSDLVG